ncbi:MAG: methionine synthase [Phycicoccus sp.]|nr:methionine synthase [Phycicoccus sp.]
MISVTGIGSWPGSDVREATVTTRDLLLDADGLGLPYLPETPARGPGSDLLGRAAGLLVDLHVDLQPAGWRLVDRPGRDAGRTAGLHRQDLDEAAAAYDGYAGPLKIQLAGPWTLAAGIELTRGERALIDPGATRDLADSLAEGLATYVADVRRLVPGAEVIVQLDEPSLPAVLEGSLPTASGYGRVRAVDPQIVAAGLRTVLARHDGRVIVHCCHDRVPIPMLRTLLREHGQGSVALDTTSASPARWESLAATLEAGVGVWCGAVATDAMTVVHTAFTTVRDGLERAGIGLSSAGTGDLGALGVTPTCGLAGATEGGARRLQRAAIELARELNEEAHR